MNEHEARLARAQAQVNERKEDDRIKVSIQQLKMTGFKTSLDRK